MVADTAASSSPQDVERAHQVVGALRSRVVAKRSGVATAVAAFNRIRRIRDKSNVKALLAGHAPLRLPHAREQVMALTAADIDEMRSLLLPPAPVAMISAAVRAGRLLGSKEFVFGGGGGRMSAVAASNACVFFSLFVCFPCRRFACCAAYLLPGNAHNSCCRCRR